MIPDFKQRRLVLHRFVLGLAVVLAVTPPLIHADDAASSPVSTSASSPRQPDPNGANTGGIADITAAKAGQPTSAELAKEIGHSKVAINMVWTLLTGFLVFFMSAGFALVETGFCRAKNAAHTASMNLLVYAVAVVGFYLCGFGIMFGGLGAIGTMGGYDGLNHEVV